MDHRDDAKDEPREDEDEDADANEPESSEDAPVAKTESKAGKTAGSKTSRAGTTARRKGRSGARDGGKQGSPSATPRSTSSRAIIVAVVALGAGVAVGWFGHDAQAKAKLRAGESTPAGASSSGPCHNWQEKLCKDTGNESATCQQAKGAAELLTPAACDAALAAVPATLAKVKAARAPCSKLVAKLCTDLPQGSAACKMVTERTPSLPPDRCKEMLEHYDDVIGQLRSMDQQQGAPMVGGPHGGPPGGPPGGMMRGAPPQ